ncbi:MAG: hypothetical protein ACRD2M_00955 [Terriglobales bacterium]
MLAGALGIRLVLWVGRSVPTPAPAELMTALTHVQVMSSTDILNSGFEMRFTLAKDKTGEYGLLANGALDPDARVAIGVLLGVTPEPLINGVIYHHELTPSNEPGLSTLTVKGRDISVMLDLKPKDEKFENQPDSVIVNRILLDYAEHGILPPHQVTPTSDVPLEIQRIPRQNETDLKFIQRLAARNGFVFYFTPLTLGVTNAYWGPQIRLGLPQPALSINLGASTNVKSLNFANDALGPEEAEGSFVEPITKTSIRIPKLPSLQVPPLVSSPRPARRTTRLRCTAPQNPAQAATTALAAATRAGEPVSAMGELETVRYGHVLRARQLVGVRGAGHAYNGNYYVRDVTHVLKPREGSYTQSFTLTREGTGALLPVVRP